MKNKILLIIFSFFTFFLFFDNVNAIVVEDTNLFTLDYENFNYDVSYGDYSISEFVQLLINTYDSNKTSNSPELLISYSRYDGSSSNSAPRINAFFVTSQSNVYYIYSPYRVGNRSGNTILNIELAFEQTNSINIFQSGLLDYSTLLTDFVSDLSSNYSPNDYQLVGSQVTFGTNKRASTSGGIVYYSGNSSRVIYGVPESLIESSTNVLYWNLTYNDSLITLGDHLPTYYEYLGLSSPPTDEPVLPDPDDVSIDKYTNNYYGFMLSQIPINNIYNYKVRFTVGQRLIYSDINYQFNLFGRINHGTYFTYEPISCSVGTSNEEPYFGSENFLDRFNVYQSKTFGIMDCSSDLTKYDYVYVNAFNENFDDNDITYFGYTSNYGYVNVNDFIASPTKVVDYFDFTKTSNMFVTSSCSSCGLYLGFDLSNFLYSFYDLSNFKTKDYLVSTTINSSFLKFYRFENIGLETNQGFGINLYSNYDSGYLYILADSNILISFDSDISSNNNFTYFDSSGNVVNNIFDVYYIYDSNVGTNVNTYFGIVSTYIDSISSDIRSISNVFQHIYDLAPETLQTLILVFYVLAMSYILFIIIRK